MEKKYRSLLFASSDYPMTMKESKEIVENSMQVCRSFALNRSSPSIDSLRAEVESVEDIDFIFNYLSPKKFPEWLIRYPKYGCFNFHPASYAYPGVGSASYALYNLEKSFGVTAHRMDEEFDRGEIIHELSFPIQKDWGCFELFNEALSKCCPLLEETIKILLKNPTPNKIKDWAGPAKTRQEFLDFMKFDVESDLRDLNLLIKAVKHPIYPGPYVKVQDHYFSYNSPEL